MAHRYFLTSLQNNTAIVSGGEALHLCKVMRIKPGDIITLCNKDGFDYICSAREISDSQIIFDILEKRKNQAQANINLTVYMALPKSDKLEFIVQKSCELGAANFVPFTSEFCVAQKSKKEENKKMRLQKISDEACKQCGSSVPMKIQNTLSFKQLLEHIKKNDINLFFYEKSNTAFKNISFDGIINVGVIVGSEGGFSQKEADLLEQCGVTTLSLGKRILRCETAAVVAVALTMYNMGEME